MASRTGREISPRAATSRYIDPAVPGKSVRRLRIASVIASLPRADATGGLRNVPTFPDILRKHLRITIPEQAEGTAAGRADRQDRALRQADIRLRGLQDPLVRGTGIEDEHARRTVAAS